MLSAREPRAQFESIRKRGVARERDEAILGEAGVAAPIFDHSLHAVGAVGVVGDSERMVPGGPASPPRSPRRPQASRASSERARGRDRARHVQLIR
jgi:DNA-binding IclR family transcriptional regulator